MLNLFCMKKLSPACNSYLKCAATAWARKNHTHAEFAFSRNIKPVFRSVPHPKERKESQPRIKLPENFMQVYPEFLPDPDINYRNKLREKLERRDMIARRKVVEIPEFYAGSIMAVTVSDPNATGKSNRFVGICIEKCCAGLRAYFTLRNVVDHIGVEIRYEQYCPLIQRIEVLRLEKRLDDNLYYLRDADPIHSTVPFDMQQELIAEGSPVPLNDTIIQLLPPPWRHRYEIKDYRGIQLPEMSEKELKEAISKRTPSVAKFDLMQEYRATIPEEEQEEIFRDIISHYPALKASERKFRRRTLSSVDGSVNP